MTTIPEWCRECEFRYGLGTPERPICDVPCTKAGAAPTVATVLTEVYYGPTEPDEDLPASRNPW